ncbi:MAG: tRNA glutamyl-Q(34) synthetase GluQRS [Pseudomonadota bacterium]|nr:tRNA glutamyl-Q(34) synthetase GluQRS [Pseudomonadota bacterium]
MYLGRFAPSPTGPLHAGSLVAALASWLDARAHGGQWLVRIEDVDIPRCVPGADVLILQQLAACGLLPDAPPVWQSRRTHLYRAALDRLAAAELAYPCACSRQDIAQAQAERGITRVRGAELPYPGTCRPEHGGPRRQPARAWRLHTTHALRHGASAPDPVIQWNDRRCGAQRQDVEREVGDFVLLRADGLWAYQLAVVVDDAAQGVTHVVRGQDLTDNTARQILLQRTLGLPTPRYLHTPLVLAADGHKLSKQNGAQALDIDQPGTALARAASTLGLSSQPVDTAVADLLASWVAEWATRWRDGTLPAI